MRGGSLSPQGLGLASAWTWHGLQSPAGHSPQPVPWAPSSPDDPRPLRREGQDPPLISLSAWRPPLPWLLAEMSPLVFSCSDMSNFLWPHGLEPARLLCPWGSPVKNTGVGSHSLSRGSPQCRDQTDTFCIAGGFVTVWATREAQRAH